MYQKRNNLLEVLAAFTCGYNKRLFLREISRLTKISLRTTQTALARLEKDNILKSKVEGRNKYFSLNTESVLAKNAILQAEVHKANCFLRAHPQVSLFLKELDPAALLVVFGSYAKGSQRKDSDLDILIVGKKENLPLHLLPFKAHIIEISESALRKSVNSQEALIKEIEQHHIILNNHSLFVNVMWRKDDFGKA